MKLEKYNKMYRIFHINVKKQSRVPRQTEERLCTFTLLNKNTISSLPQIS